jgi:hypothetical protein
MSWSGRTRLAALAALLGIGSAALAPAATAEQRQHGAHVHGSGELELVLEGAVLQIALYSPAANIVGFEHAPADAAARSALDRARRALADAARLFHPPKAAGCRLEQASVELPWAEHADQPDAHGAHDHTAHAPAAVHDDHADITAEYRFVCNRPEAVDSLRVDLFDVFPATERLEARFVLERSQGAATLTSADRMLGF